MNAPTRHGLNVTVAARTLIARDVLLLDFELSDGTPLPGWSPGAHIDLYLPGCTRQYSLCGDPLDRSRYQVAVLRQADGRGGSEYVHANLSPGTTLSISRPRNHFPLVDASSYVFIAGGIGITPIRAMIRECERNEKPWELHYGGRSLDSMAFADELASLDSRVEIVPQDERGLLRLDEIVDQGPDDGVVYCCGPEPLLVAIEDVMAERHGRELHVERFAPSVPKHLPDDAGVEVFCEESQVTVHVGTQETILDALIAAGIDVNFDCREGTCGTCELEVIEGTPDHRDVILSRTERETAQIFYPCVSRAQSRRIVLDV